METCNNCEHTCHCIDRVSGREAPDNEHKIVLDCDCENCEHS